LNLGDTSLWIIFSSLFVLLLFRVSNLSRFFLAWSALSLFPFAVRAYAPRFTYFFYIPLALFFGAWVSGLLEGRGKKKLLGVFLCVLASLAAVGNMLRVTTEISAQKMEGEKCRAILSWCKENGIGEEKELYIDTVAPALTNGFSEMLHLFLDSNVKLKNMHLLVIPPFIVFGTPEFESLNPDAVLLRFKPAAPPDFPYPTYEKITKSEMVKGARTIPMFDFRYAYEVVIPQRMLKRVQEGKVNIDESILIDREPSLAINPQEGPPARILNITAVTRHKVILNVYCPQPCLFLMCLPVRLDTRKAKVFVNHVPVKPFRAFGIFNALELSSGNHNIIATIF
jgi:hypothetical protein